MRKTLSILVRKIGSIFTRLSWAIYLEPKITPKAPLNIRAQRAKPWFEINGDKTLRLDYPNLSEDSLVIDLGGYEGQWTSDIYSKYCSKIWVFEPYKPYFRNIERRFSNNSNIKVFDFGLSSFDMDLPFSVNDDESSAFKSSDEKSPDVVHLKAVIDFFESQKVQQIDLIKINIEGGEYDLLECLVASKWIKKISNIQVQFHDFVENAEQRMKALQENLSKTHKPTYQFEFIWENWELKK